MMKEKNGYDDGGKLQREIVKGGGRVKRQSFCLLVF